ncbi:CDP-glucose 4,6-dehydratase [Shuttleworthella satelles]|mgnify:CR=1 FL=1|nr:CDP-glucose 4,6-dehydratase [Shuttleworthia satelles]
MGHFEELKAFYAGKRVFVTGHTGFKGSWMCKILSILGAEVYGYSLTPPSDPAAFDIMGVEKEIHSTIGDIRDFEALKSAYRQAKPDCVFHLAAQPIVRASYDLPRYTYETNVMGTVNILECLRLYPGAESFLNITTDKVYENNDLADHAFQEDEKLDGYDPYSNSKSCSEIVTHSYKKSFFSHEGDIAISTARAGNVIGGGDFAADRIVPDCVRSTVEGKTIGIRNPYSTRPFQHVLEPLYVYLMIVMKQAEDPSYAGYYNVGPVDEDCITAGQLADYFVQFWGQEAAWKSQAEPDAPHEANFLKLDCSKLRHTLGWKPVWRVDEAIRHTVEWYRAWHEGADMAALTEEQIRAFLQ